MPTNLLPPLKGDGKGVYRVHIVGNSCECRILLPSVSRAETGVSFLFLFAGTGKVSAVRRWGAEEVECTSVFSRRSVTSSATSSACRASTSTDSSGNQGGRRPTRKTSGGVSTRRLRRMKGGGSSMVRIRDLSGTSWARLRILSGSTLRSSSTFPASLSVRCYAFLGTALHVHPDVTKQSARCSSRPTASSGWQSRTIMFKSADIRLC